MVLPISARVDYGPQQVDGQLLDQIIQTINALVTGTVTTRTGTAETFATSDAGGYTRMNNAASIAATIALEANVPMPVGAVLTVEQTGAGVVTFTAAVGVTLLAAGGLVATNGQGAVASAKKTGLNTWTVFGNLA